MVAYFSRTCFRPCWDYIDAYDYMNMLEALGLHHLSKKAKTKSILSLVKPFELKYKNLFFYEPIQRTFELKRKTSFSTLIFRTSGAY